MGNAAQKTKPGADSLSGANTKLSQVFEGRESNELVVGFAGPVGCGLKDAISIATELIKEFDYEVEIIKVSELIKKFCANKSDYDVQIDPSKNYERYTKLQKAGNLIRKNYRSDILAEMVVTKIALNREVKKSKKQDETQSKPIPKRTVYIIDQLKHPHEVGFLRKVYRNLFYLIGVLSCEEKRKKRLKEEDIDEKEVAEIMDRDKSENIDHGQQLEKTLELSDLFIRNSYGNRKRVRNQFKRFYELLHGIQGITPTQHEYAMYIAYAAAQKSACISRQVGTAITDQEGVVLSTGCNDVPKYNGGLYCAADGENDHRCLFKDAICYNDFHKDKLCEEIKSILSKHGVEKKAEQIALDIRQTTKLKDLIEYSRSVHAEMDAITSAARKGSVSIQDGYLYSTTFPCHSCARHIIASGIRKVFYIEPYEKSLAYTLHDDAIVLDPEDDDKDQSKVQFLHFEGISPRKFQNFFLTGIPRKDKKGEAVKSSKLESRKVIPEYLDSYEEFELKVLKNMKEMGINVEIFK